jgi:plasmid stabilization system protein ParE
VKVRWTQEAIDFLEAQEDYMSGLGVRIVAEAEEKLRRFVGVHVRVPVVLKGGKVRHVYRMLLSKALPYKVYYEIQEDAVVVVAVRHARQRPIESSEWAQ